MVLRTTTAALTPSRTAEPVTARSPTCRCATSAQVVRPFADVRPGAGPWPDAAAVWGGRRGVRACLNRQRPGFQIQKRDPDMSNAISCPGGRWWTRADALLGVEGIHVCSVIGTGIGLLLRRERRGTCEFSGIDSRNIGCAALPILQIQITGVLRPWRSRLKYGALALLAGTTAWIVLLALAK